jgi:hypothetical protein
MKTWKRDYRGAGLFFVLALAVHVALIMVPLTKKMTTGVQELRSVQIRLVTSEMPGQETPPAEQAPEWRESGVPLLEELPPMPEKVAPRVRETVQQAPPPNSKRVLSSQFDYERSIRQPLFGTAERKADAPDFHFRQRATLEMVLNQPSMQLPFKDTRTYVVEHYEDGFMGGIDKFWDRVSVPFGFTTKNNTRVQCVWVLVIAGCGWGHKTLFHQPARYRERQGSPAIENS